MILLLKKSKLKNFFLYSIVLLIVLFVSTLQAMEGPEQKISVPNELALQNQRRKEECSKKVEQAELTTQQLFEKIKTIGVKAFKELFGTCNPWSVNEDNKTILHRIVELKRNDLLYPKLFERSDLLAQDKDGLTPFLRAICSGNEKAVEKLLAHFVQCRKQESSGKYKEEQEEVADELYDALQVADESPDALQAVDSKDNNPVHLAIIHKYKSIACRLITSGLWDLQQRNEARETPLEAAKRLELNSVVELLAPPCDQQGPKKTKSQKKREAKKRKEKENAELREFCLNHTPEESVHYIEKNKPQRLKYLYPPL